MYVCTLMCMLMWRLGVDGYSTGIHPFLTLEPPLLGLHVCAIIPAFYVGVEDFNSGPHVCPASSLLTETSPQPLIYLSTLIL